MKTLIVTEKGTVILHGTEYDLIFPRKKAEKKPIVKKPVEKKEEPKKEIQEETK